MAVSTRPPRELSTGLAQLGGVWRSLGFGDPLGIPVAQVEVVIGIPRKDMNVEVPERSG